MIDKFSKETFEDFLERVIVEYQERLPPHATVLPLGLSNYGEYTYKIPLGNNGWLWFNSSVDASGFAADAGHDSIRLWVGDFTGKGLLKKEQEWTTRMAGWQGRLMEQVDSLTAAWKKRVALLQRMKDSDERTMLAKYDGWCKVCKKGIAQGEPIALREVAGRGKQWVHFECPVVTLLPLDKVTSSGFNPTTSRMDEGGIEALAETASQSLEALADFFAKTAMEVVVEEPVKVFTPSSYQQAIFDWVQHGTGNAVVQAVAGSGKTTTLVETMKYIPTMVYDQALGAERPAKVAFVAFNKPIQLELKRRQDEGLIPEHVLVCTLHSLGLRNLAQILQVTDTRDFIDEHKVETIMDGFPQLSKSRYLPIDERMANIVRRQVVKQVATLCKNTQLNAVKASRDLDNLYDLADHYGLDLQGATDEDLGLVTQILERCATGLHTIDFDDMCWLPVELGFELEKFDFLMVDEAQDLNAVQIAFVMKSVAPGGRVLAVGDPAQSLYGFRGADTEAIPRLIKMLDAKTLDLSVCYRCPTSHIYLAQAIVPAIQPRPDAPEGLVATITKDQVIGIVEPGDMIICRTNAPLVPMAYALIRKGVKAVVRGRDIGKGLVELIDKFNAPNLGELVLGMREYLERETVRLTNAEKWEQLQNLQDRVETIHEVMSECVSVNDLRTKITNLFSDTVAGVVLSSVHRAKGLQSKKRVIILRPDLLPHPLAKKPWQQVQEMNAKYVALTRSPEELLFVEEG